MADKLISIPNDETKKYPFYRFQSNEPTNQNLIKVPKVVEPTTKKTLGTSVINSPISPASLILYSGMPSFPYMSHIIKSLELL